MAYALLGFVRSYLGSPPASLSAAPVGAFPSTAHAVRFASSFFMDRRDSSEAPRPVSGRSLFSWELRPLVFGRPSPRARHGDRRAVVQRTLRKLRRWRWPSSWARLLEWRRGRERCRASSGRAPVRAVALAGEALRERRRASTAERRPAAVAVRAHSIAACVGATPLAPRSTHEAHAHSSSCGSRSLSAFVPPSLRRFSQPVTRR